MSTQVTIQSVTGATTPLDLWICDDCSTTATCQYVDTITTLPHTFTLPSIYEVATQYAIKLNGPSGCTFCSVYT
jgi:hypothetical protein